MMFAVVVLYATSVGMLLIGFASAIALFISAMSPLSGVQAENPGFWSSLLVGIHSGQQTLWGLVRFGIGGGILILIGTVIAVELLAGSSTR